MKQFASVVRELRAWLASLSWIRGLLPYHLHLLFGGVGIQFLYDLLLRIVPYSGYNAIDTLFNKIPLYVIGYYGFLLGIWLTLVSRNVRYLPYGLWAYAFVLLFPFEYLGLQTIVSAILYVLFGYALFRYSASSYSETDTRNVNF
ncbi:hypothetical protein GE107_15580 [Cohnella sp. CFH 77786]|uniref:hypothetical protein n=1 Tax=Cohnella sp. CFH 77786 TaxID=2662265 RepID=UPI001C60D730|nr:hypothetical protein [Cohnella sp. CFH 77786]MBW5447478.1 hypothetical protein [Cohnella sp. CFH 77786]